MGKILVKDTNKGGQSPSPIIFKLAKPIETADIANNAITTTKIADEAVTADKLDPDILSSIMASIDHVDGKIAANTQAITTERNRAEGAEQTLDGKIGELAWDLTKENLRAEGAEQALDIKIGANTTAIATEKTRAESAEHDLDTKIELERTGRIQATSILSRGIAEIEEKIPSEASGLNKLADKEYVDSKVRTEQTRADGVEHALQASIANEAQTRWQADQTLDGKIGANTQAISTEKTRAEGAEQTLQTAIDAINGKIPAQATSQNQLADKAFVNSSVSTATADFKGTYNSLEDLEQVTANANDYAFVIANDAAGNTLYKRYKWVEGTGWTWEYDLNNSSFTQAQWAAIQSGITAALVTKLSDLPDNSTLNQRITQAIANALLNYYTKSEIDAALGNKQDVIQDLAIIRSGASAGATAVQPAAIADFITASVDNLVNYYLKSQIDTFLAQKADLSVVNSKEDTMQIENIGSGTTELSAVVGRYYTFEDNLETFSIVLPTITDLTKVATIVFFIGAGSTPAITFTSSHPIYYHDGFELEAGKTYEVNALFNGNAWVIASVEIIIGEE